MPSLHPALYAPGITHHRSDPASPVDGEHFVPEGWEELDRGACPCGELVQWNEVAERWEPDRTLRLLVLTSAEAQKVTAPDDEWLRDMIGRQLALNEWEDTEPDDGQVLIAGVLYDAETLQEA